MGNFQSLIRSSILFLFFIVCHSLVPLHIHSSISSISLSYSPPSLSFLSLHRHHKAYMTRQRSVWNTCSRVIAGTPARRRLSILVGGVCVFFALSFCHPNSVRLAQEYSERLRREISSKVTRAIANTLTDTCTVVNEQITKKKATTGNHWIVVTTINPPTDAMEILCNLEGWNVRFLVKKTLCASKLKFN